MVYDGCATFLESTSLNLRSYVIIQMYSTIKLDENIIICINNNYDLIM